MKGLPHNEISGNLNSLRIHHFFPNGTLVGKTHALFYFRRNFLNTVYTQKINTNIFAQKLF